MHIPEPLARMVERAHPVGPAAPIEITIREAGTWSLHPGGQLVAGPTPTAAVRISLEATALEELLADRGRAQRLAWEGRLEVEGDRMLLAELLDRVSVGRSAGDFVDYFETLAALVPAEEFIHMNLGYASEEEPREEQALDPTHRYCLQLIEKVLGRARLQGRDILDVGCGRGGTCAHIVQRHHPARVVGVDLAPTAIVRCRERWRYPELTFVAGDACALPFEEATFDVVVNLESSYCYPDRLRFFEEVRRVLRPGGDFCYADAFPSEQVDSLRDGLAHLPGFTLEEEEELTEGVARALVASRVGFTARMLSLCDDTLRNGRILSHLIHTNTQQFAPLYQQRRLRYLRWHLRRANSSGGRA